MEQASQRTLAGRSLYEVVEEYARFGNHCTGTEVDFATTDWLMRLLDELGGSPHLEPWKFDRYAAKTTLVCDGSEVPTLPVWYSALGDVETDRVNVVRAPANVAGSASGLDELLAANTDDAAMVIAVDGPDDLPVQCNRVPTSAGGNPAVIIPSNWYDRVASGDATLRFTGAISPGKSANVLATFGTPGAPVVRVTTPLTGWTPAAGERGTGLAVALALALDLSQAFRVEVSACAGHEIDHLGLRHHLSQRDLAGEVTIHLGASVAAVEHDADGHTVLGSSRRVLTSASEPHQTTIATLARQANFSLLDVEPPWPGEGETWRAAGANVLSFLGSSPFFHVTDDVPSKATTPQALATATDAVIAAARSFVASTPSTSRTRS